MDKSLKELGAEYIEAAENIDRLIKKCTKEINEANKKREYKKCFILKHNRMIFYSQKRELMETANKLLNYYKREEIH